MTCSITFFSSKAFKNYWGNSHKESITEKSIISRQLWCDANEQTDGFQGLEK